MSLAHLQSQLVFMKIVLRVRGVRVILYVVPDEKPSIQTKYLRSADSQTKCVVQYRSSYS